MQLSHFGEKFTRTTGILELMDDMGNAMANGGPETKMLGGGNPAHIPEVQESFRKRMLEIARSKDAFARMVGNYATPQGDPSFLRTAAQFLKKHYGWKVTEKNIAVLNGSQTALFLLFNMLAGECAAGKKKRILLPLVPEYIGYADQGICEDMFVAHKPKIEVTGPHRFKYAVDVATLDVPRDAAAICVSRPTNPTGNVVTDEEVRTLHALAKKRRIPLIIDDAYGIPGPNILFTDITQFWDEHVIHVLSLSKFGLPGVRTSIVVASEKIISQISSIHAIVALAPSNIGPELVRPMLESGSLIALGDTIIKPFYAHKRHKVEQYFAQYFDDALPYYLHAAEGSLFLWLWCKSLPITSKELYQRLKKRGVIIVPGEYFFPGHTGRWKHKSECIRVSYAQSEEAVEEGICIIGEEIVRAYNDAHERRFGQK